MNIGDPPIRVNAVYDDPLHSQIDLLTGDISFTDATQPSGYSNCG